MNDFKFIENYGDLEPEEFLKYWYQNFYNDFTYSDGSGLIQNLMHSSLESKLKGQEYPSVLEIGAFSGQHIKFLKHNFKKYVLLDIIIPKQVMFEGHFFVNADGRNLPFADCSFDRVLTTCVLHHVNDPERILREIRRVAKNNSVITIFLPSDPSLLFRLAKKLGPLRKAKKMGILEIKKLVDARDHVNNYVSLDAQVRHIFRNDSIQSKCYPLNFLRPDLSLWQIFTIHKVIPK